MAEELTELEADDAHATVEAGAFLLDVREPDEWAAGHAGSVHIPMGELGSRLDDLPRDRRIVAICRTGARSRSVGEALAREGFDVVNAFGGLKAWEAFGFEVVDDTGGAGVVI